MHGQKKRRKRLVEGVIVLGNINLNWQLLSEPQLSTEHGYKGLCISVRAEAGSSRELVLVYPYPIDRLGSPLPLPQRPKLSVRTIEADVQQAITEGWDPASRGKTLIFNVS
jgi:hypothetical protein